MGIIQLTNRVPFSHKVTPITFEVNGVTGYGIGYSDWFFSEDGMTAVEIIHTRSGDFQFKLYEVNENGDGLDIRTDCRDYWWTRADALQAARSCTSARF